MNPSDLGLLGFKEYRNHQLETAMGIYGSESRFCVLDAPTGSGKSLINMTTIALTGGRGLVLTAKKGLQDQLMRDFGPSGMVDVRGADNYTCPGFGTCGMPSRLGEQCDRESLCPRSIAIDRARAARYVTTNYHTWMSFLKYGDPKALGTFDVLILDEAHLAPKILSDFTSITIRRSEVEELLGLSVSSDMPFGEFDSEDAESVQTWCTWAHTVIDKARKKYKELSSASPQERDRVQKLGTSLAEMVRIRERGVYESWQAESQGRKLLTLTPSPWPVESAEKLLFAGCKKIVLSSAFLPPGLGKRLGIQTEERFSVPTTFPSESRPFYYVPTVPVDRKLDPIGLLRLVAMIDKTIQTRQDRKGVIHCRSYAWAQKIKASSRYSHLMMAHDAEGAKSAIKLFQESDRPNHRILLSPSVEEGYDFVGDLCRWQIVLKVPFIDGRSGITRSRAEFSRLYVYEEAALSLLQMVGRGMRSREDKCETFIFDTHWSHFKRKAQFPFWFRQSWKESTTIPPPMQLK